MFIAMQLTFALTHTIFGREMILVGHGNWYLYLSLILWNSTRSVLHLSCILIVSKLYVVGNQQTWVDENTELKQCHHDGQ